MLSKAFTSTAVRTQVLANILFSLLNAYGCSVSHKTSYTDSGPLLSPSITTDKWHENILYWKLSASSYILASMPNQPLIVHCI